jgi:hypothetical protein
MLATFSVPRTDQSETSPDASASGDAYPMMGGIRTAGHTVLQNVRVEGFGSAVVAGPGRLDLENVQLRNNRVGVDIEGEQSHVRAHNLKIE